MAAYPQLARLIELRESGWFFQPVQVQSELELLTGWRTWPDGWSDALAIRDLGNARAFRCEPTGDEVWKHEGGLVDVIDGLMELPAPDDPKAPRLVKAKAPVVDTGSRTALAVTSEPWIRVAGTRGPPLVLL